MMRRCCTRTVLSCDANVQSRSGHFSVSSLPYILVLERRSFRLHFKSSVYQNCHILMFIILLRVACIGVRFSQVYTSHSVGGMQGCVSADEIFTAVVAS